MIFQFNIYLNTDFAVTFSFFFSLHLALAGYAAFLSAFLRSGGQVSWLVITPNPSPSPDPNPNPNPNPDPNPNPNPHPNP